MRVCLYTCVLVSGRERVHACARVSPPPHAQAASPLGAGVLAMGPHNKQRAGVSQPDVNYRRRQPGDPDVTDALLRDPRHALGMEKGH